MKTGNSIIIILLSMLCCQPKTPENINEIFSNWFVNPNEPGKKIITGSRLSPKQLDSIASDIRQKQPGTGAYTSKLYDSDGTEFIMGYATPGIIKIDSLYPLIIYLHGGIGTTLNNKGEKAYEMFSFLADTVDMFLASPSANRTVPWWSEAGFNRILKTVRYMTLHFPIDPSRIFLAGVSDGAAGCYAAANSTNGPFAGFIAVSGYGGILSQLGIRLYPSNMMQRQIYNINGGKDHLFPQDVVQDFLNQLKQSGVTIKQKFYPEQGHGFDYRENEKATLAEIITSWKKPETGNISWFPVDNAPNNADNLISWEKCGDINPEAQITGWWKGDTLNVRSKGVCSFSMISEKKSLFLKSSEGKIKQVKALDLNTDYYLELMQHFCYPVVSGRNIFYINVQN